MTTINKEYTKILKINNIWEAVIHSQDYKNKYDNCEVNDIIKNNNDYWKIEISSIKGKYTKNEKYIDIELYYNDNHAIINIAQILLNDLMNDIKDTLSSYGIFY